MGWWSLGPEDEDEMMDMPPPPPSRRARGGAGRAPGGRGGAGRVPPERPSKKDKKQSSKSKRGKSAKKKNTKKIVEAPTEEKEPNLFASIGRMVSSGAQPRQASDASTIGTAKYPGQNGVPVKASSNANEAARRANDMANAMGWLTNPAAKLASDKKSEPDAGADLFGDAGNWWESEFDVDADDDVSLFSNNSDVQAEDMPDLMALLMHRQDDAEEEKKKKKQMKSLSNSDSVVQTEDIPNHMARLEQRQEENESKAKKKRIDDVLARSGGNETMADGGLGGALDWLRQRQAEKATSGVDGRGDLANVADVSTVRKNDEEKIAEQMTGALDWLRSGVNPSAAEEAPEPLEKTGEMVESQNTNINILPSTVTADEYSGAASEANEAKRLADEMANALAWISEPAAGQEPDESSLASSNSTLKKADALMPKTDDDVEANSDEEEKETLGTAEHQPADSEGELSAVSKGGPGKAKIPDFGNGSVGNEETKPLPGKLQIQALGNERKTSTAPKESPGKLVIPDFDNGGSSVGATKKAPGKLQMQPFDNERKALPTPEESVGRLKIPLFGNGGNDGKRTMPIPGRLKLQSFENEGATPTTQRKLKKSSFGNDVKEKVGMPNLIPKMLQQPQTNKTMQAKVTPRDPSLSRLSPKAEKALTWTMPSWDTNASWNGSYEEVNMSRAADRPETFDSETDMKKAIGWWSANQHYKPPHNKNFGGDVKRAMKVSRALESYRTQEILPLKRKTRTIGREPKRLPLTASSYIHVARHEAKQRANSYLKDSHGLLKLLTWTIPNCDTNATWNGSYEEVNMSRAVDRPEIADSKTDMKKAIGWWSTNQHYKPPHNKNFGGDVKRVMKVNRAFERYRTQEILPLKRKTRTIEREPKRLPSTVSSYTNVTHEFEWNQGTFDKVHVLFSNWNIDETLQSGRRYDPTDDPEEAKERAKDLKDSLGLILSDEFDNDDPQYSCAAISRLKDLLADLKLRDVTGVEELEGALNWWELHASTYNPFTSSNKDDEMFVKSKKLVSMFGLNEGGSWNDKNREVEEALSLWKKYILNDFEDLDIPKRRVLKRVKSAMLQFKRDGLDMADMKSMAKEMDETLTWFLDKGSAVGDLSNANGVASTKFQRTKVVLGAWGIQNVPLPEQLEEIEECLVSFHQKKHGDLAITADKFDDDHETPRFRVLEDVMLDWKLKQAGADTISPEEGETLGKTLEDALDWWIANGDDFDVEAADMKQVFMAQIIKSLLDSWIGRKGDEDFSFEKSKHGAKKIKEALALYRRTGRSFDVAGLNIKSSYQRRLLKLENIMLRWRRDTATTTFGADAEDTINDMMNGLKWWKEKGKRYDPVADRAKHLSSTLRDKQVSRSLDDFGKYSVFPERVYLQSMSKREQKKMKKELESALDWLNNLTDIKENSSADEESVSVDNSSCGIAKVDEAEEFHVAAGVGADFQPEDCPDIMTLMMQRQQYSLGHERTMR